MLCFCVWPGMVLNQRQVSLVVSENHVGVYFLSSVFCHLTELFWFHFFLFVILFSVLS
jgi:hypothetical protein